MPHAEDVPGGYRLGVDVGGTFTDVCVFTPDGKTVRAKTPTTVYDQSVGVKDGIRKVRELLKEQYGWDGKFDFVNHGTTTATNAVLEGKGAKTALVVTAGHKDVLALRRSQIPGGLGAWINWEPPTPIVPLERTIQCVERMSVHGETVIPVDKENLRKELEDLKVQKPKVVAICLLNSYCSAKHEKEVAEVVREELGSNVEIVCSADVLREAGEYERSVTTSANALVKPVVINYLENLAEKLAEDSSKIRILKSDGALTSLNLAGEFPVHILMSGPAGGTRGVADVISKATPFKDLITLDMGGTSSDCALIKDSKPSLRRETIVGNLSVRAPAVDVRTVGAGGGSIAKYSPMTNTMSVGPESAGAAPGPACYGQGGELSTVTDANVVLGYLPSKLLGGDFELDVKAATTAVEKLAHQMGVSTFQAAEDIIRLANEKMYGAVRLVSVEQGYDPRDFSLVAFGGAGPLHANAVGKLLGAWPVIIPPSPGVLCAQGDVTTRLSHEKSTSYIRSMNSTTSAEIRTLFEALEKECTDVMHQSLSGYTNPPLSVAFEVDVRYKGQALTLSIPLEKNHLDLPTNKFSILLGEKFNAAHQQQFHYSLPNFELELMRCGVIVTDASPEMAVPTVEKAVGSDPPSDALLYRKPIVVDGNEVEAAFWDRRKVSKSGIKLNGPCVVTEMDSNTLILPGFYGEIDNVGNILINPVQEQTREAVSHTPESAKALVQSNHLIPTLIASALASIRNEMDTLMLRCAMSPAIREQQDEFNVITNNSGQMLVGQFGSFLGQFLDMWKGTIEEGDVFITNDVYEVSGAVTHLNDVIILLPIWYNSKLVGWAANFGHLTDVGGKVAGSMSINATSVYEDGVQIPTVKLYEKGKYNDNIVNILCRNSRQPDWYRSDLTALVASCRTAAARVCELNERFGPNVYEAACNELLDRNRMAVAQIIEKHFDSNKYEFTDYVDDDGHGVGPWIIKCSMQKTADNGLAFDWDGTAPQAENSINYYLSETMFKMFIGYYLLACFAPGTVINDGFHDLITVNIPEGSVLKPVRPAPVSCRTHFLARTMDVIQALLGQQNEAYQAAAGFSDSPHFFYSGFKPNGEWYQLYQIGFGGVPARPAGDGPDCHCLFPAIKSVPTESIELNFPLRIEANESLADSGGPGFYRGGNAQKTLYRFLCRGEFSIHDDRWFTKPWGVKGGKPGQRSRKILYRYSQNEDNPPTQVLPSKCDHIRVEPGDLLEWITWGGGGLGDPLTRPAEKVALEVHRRLVTFAGARKNYGVVVNPDFTVDEVETSALRKNMGGEITTSTTTEAYDRGGSIAELRERCVAETGLPAPRAQWEDEPYGPHVALPYVQNWFKEMRMKEGKGA